MIEFNKVQVDKSYPYSYLLGLGDDSYNDMLLLGADEGMAESRVFASKPYPSEHACRLTEPSKLKNMRRANNSREHEGKKYDVIYGKNLEGKMVQQAFRYDKTKWTAEQAKKHCSTHGGILFEPAKKSIDCIGDAALPAPIMDIIEKSQVLRAWLDYEGASIVCGKPVEVQKADSGTVMYHQSPDGMVLKMHGSMFSGDYLLTDSCLTKIGQPKATFVAKSFEEPEYIIGGIVYTPNEEDAQKDKMTKEEIWKMMKHYMIRCRVLKVEHTGRYVDLPIIEAFQPEEDTKKGGQVVPAGSFWLSVYAGNDPEMFYAAKAGDITGFSFEASTLRRPE